MTLLIQLLSDEALAVPPGVLWAAFEGLPGALVWELVRRE
jgi:hypothetical protein